ncbi:MAG TPA: hypothetical protein VFZ27_18590 [Terriglobia bacterium]|nr:hypothetical protein [Terriglobia bacterium]
MRNLIRHLSISASVLLFAFGAAVAAGQNGTETSKSQQPSNPAGAAGRTAAQNSPDREGTNGIFVGSPKVYDDSELESLLQNARSRLSQINGFDQASLTSHLGSVQGAAATQRQIALQATAVSPGSNPSSPLSPSLPSPPSFPLPSNFPVSASDLLNEQTQLTYELINLQLLLGGSLNDQFMPGSNEAKFRTTLGFPINISVPQGSKYQNAVAEVEVTVCNPAGLGDNRSLSPPSLVSILPEEKTYNVANVVSKALQIGGGSVAGVFSFGGSFLRGRQTFYLVRDQDTVAVQVPPRKCGQDKDKDPGSATFAWEFRPVLGQHLVRDGIRNTFAQISFDPYVADRYCTIEANIRTGWRRYDRKTGRVGAWIGNYETEDRDIPTFGLPPIPKEARADDNGDGTLTVWVKGSFKAGTRVRIGDTFLNESTPGFERNTFYVVFKASAADIAAHGARLVTDNGREADIVNVNGRQVKESPVAAGSCATSNFLKKFFKWTSLALKNIPETSQTNFPATPSPQPPPPSLPTVVPYTDSTSLLTLPLAGEDRPKRNEPLDGLPIVVIGPGIFGLRDSPFYEMTDSSVSLVVPNSLLRTYHSATWMKLFTPDHATFPIALGTPAQGGHNMSSDYAVSGIVLLAGSPSNQYVITGSHLEGTKILQPSLEPDVNTSYIMEFHLSDSLAKAYKNIVIQHGNDAPTVLALPKQTATGSDKPSVDPQKGTVLVGSTRIPIAGTALNQVVDIRYQEKPLAFEPVDTKSLTVLVSPDSSGLTATAGSRRLQFILSDKSWLSYDLKVTAPTHK